MGLDWETRGVLADFCRCQIESRNTDLVFHCANGNVTAHQMIFASISRLFKNLMQRYVIGQELIPLDLNISLPEIRREHMEMVAEVAYTGQVNLTKSDYAPFREICKLLELRFPITDYDQLCVSQCNDSDDSRSNANGEDLQALKAMELAGSSERSNPSTVKRVSEQQGSSSTHKSSFYSQNDEPTFTCPDCLKGIPSKRILSHLIMHLKKELDEFIADDQSVPGLKECKLCSYAASSHGKMRRHVGVSHKILLKIANKSQMKFLHGAEGMIARRNRSSSKPHKLLPIKIVNARSQIFPNEDLPAVWNIEENDSLENTNESQSHIVEDTNESESHVVEDTNECESNPVEDANECESNPVEDANECESNPVEDVNECESNPVKDANECESNPVEDANECESNPVEDANECESNPVEDANECESNPVEDANECESHVVEDPNECESHVVEDPNECESHVVEDPNECESHVVEDPNECESHVVEDAYECESHAVEDAYESESHAVEAANESESHVVQDANEYESNAVETVNECESLALNTTNVAGSPEGSNLSTVKRVSKRQRSSTIDQRLFYSPYNEPTFECPDCLKRLPSRRIPNHVIIHLDKDLSEFIEDSQSGPGLEKCKVCSYVTPTHSLMRTHVGVRHKILLELVNEGQMKFLQCAGGMFARKRSLSSKPIKRLPKKALRRRSQFPLKEDLRVMSDVRKQKTSEDADKTESHALTTTESTGRRVSKRQRSSTIYKSLFFSPNDELTFECPDCRIRLPSTQVQNHVIIHLEKDLNKFITDSRFVPGLEKCKLCSFEASSHSNMRRHVGMTHKMIAELTTEDQKKFLHDAERELARQRRSSYQPHMLWPNETMKTRSQWLQNEDLSEMSNTENSNAVENANEIESPPRKVSTNSLINLNTRHSGETELPSPKPLKKPDLKESLRSRQPVKKPIYARNRQSSIKCPDCRQNIMHDGARGHMTRHLSKYLDKFVVVDNVSPLGRNRCKLCGHINRFRSNLIWHVGISHNLIMKFANESQRQFLIDSETSQRNLKYLDRPGRLSLPRKTKKMSKEPEYYHSLRVKDFSKMVEDIHDIETNSVEDDKGRNIDTTNSVEDDNGRNIDTDNSFVDDNGRNIQANSDKEENIRDIESYSILEDNVIEMVMEDVCADS